MLILCSAVILGEGGGGLCQLRAKWKKCGPCTGSHVSPENRTTAVILVFRNKKTLSRWSIFICPALGGTCGDQLPKSVFTLFLIWYKFRNKPPKLFQCKFGWSLLKQTWPRGLPSWPVSTKLNSDLKLQICLAHMCIDWMKIITRRGETSQLLPVPVSFVTFFLISNWLHCRYLQETNHELVLKQLSPKIRSCTRPVIYARNTPHLYKHLFRSVQDMLCSQGFTAQEHLFSSLQI
jgi:hypothetical protein